MTPLLIAQIGLTLFVFVMLLNSAAVMVYVERKVAALLQQRLSPKVTLGCIAEAVIGLDREIEQQPALSLWLARWAGAVTMQPFHLTLERTADGPSLPGWPDNLVAGPGEGEAGASTHGGRPSAEPFGKPRSAVLLLGDPFTFPIDADRYCPSGETSMSNGTSVYGQVNT